MFPLCAVFDLFGTESDAKNELEDDLLRFSMVKPFLPRHKAQAYSPMFPLQLLSTTLRYPIVGQFNYKHQADGVQRVTFRLPWKTFKSLTLPRKEMSVGDFVDFSQNHAWIGCRYLPQGELLYRGLAEPVSKTIKSKYHFDSCSGTIIRSCCPAALLVFTGTGELSSFQAFTTGCRPSSCGEDTEKNGGIRRMET